MVVYQIWEIIADISCWFSERRKEIIDPSEILPS